HLFPGAVGGPRRDVHRFQSGGSGSLGGAQRPRSLSSASFCLRLSLVSCLARIAADFAGDSLANFWCFAAFLLACACFEAWRATGSSACAAGAGTVTVTAGVVTTCAGAAGAATAAISGALGALLVSS